MELQGWFGSLKRVRVERELEPFQQAAAQSCRAFIFPVTSGKAKKNPLEAGRYIHRWVQFRQHGLCSCLIAETIVRSLFSGKEEILSVPYWD